MKFNPVPLAIVLTLSIGGFLGAQSQTSSQEDLDNQRGSTTQHDAMNQNNSSTKTSPVNDKTLSAKINETFAKDKAFAPLGIQVESLNGVVTLKGTVPSQTELDRAIEVTRNITGVNRVKSKLIIQKNAADPNTLSTDKTNRIDPTAGGDSANPTNDVPVSDADLTKMVQGKIASDRSIPPGQITVDITNGDAILRGNITDKAQEATLIQLVKSVEGVKDVRSMLIVKPTVH